MTRRIAHLTLDNLDDLPERCRGCVFWELDPVLRRRAESAGEGAHEKEAWVSRTLLEWGSCGRVAYVDGEPHDRLVPANETLDSMVISHFVILLRTSN